VKRNAPPFRRWIRLNIFDGWQALGALGFVLGLVMFATLILNANQVLTATGGTIKLVQTFSSDAPDPLVRVSPSAEAPIPQPSAQPTVAPNPAPVQPAPTRSRVVRPAPTHRATPAPTETPSPTPTPSPSATPRPSIR
jgi:hypothetical protein